MFSFMDGPTRVLRPEELQLALSFRIPVSAAREKPNTVNVQNDIPPQSRHVTIIN